VLAGLLLSRLAPMRPPRAAATPAPAPEGTP
jgi:hypothetical protein